MADVVEPESPLDDRVVGAPIDALGALAGMIELPQVRVRWSAWRVLPGYTVGGIAGHVLGLMRRFCDVLEADALKPVSGDR